MESKPQAPGGGRPQRKLRNYLLDERFQLKFAAYFVVLTLIVAGILAVFLVITTDSLFAEMNGAVDARSRAAETSRELGTCSLNNELTRNLDNPDFALSLAARSAAIDDAFEAEKQAVLAQKADLVSKQKRTLALLLAALLGFVVLVALGSIMLTHRIVGPLFRIKRMAREVASGVIRPPTYGLRPGDELVDVFDIFKAMVTFLRGQAEADQRALDQALAGDREALLRLKEDFERRLAATPPGAPR
jgi:nitrogen fixation/metabolism regulation signal transduction histidine kinase